MPLIANVSSEINSKDKIHEGTKKIETAYKWQFLS